MEKTILLYNLKNDKGVQIRRICSPLHISCRDVEPSEYMELIGALAGMPGFPRRQQSVSPVTFSEEMMIFCDFNSDDIYNFLSRSKAAGIAPVHLKAALTPHNVQWNSLQIREELLKEHAAMNGGSAK